MNRTLVIGDIHGGLRALTQVLESAGVTSGDHLIFLGDYVDGWSESAQLISYLMELNKTHRCDFIYGNHDAWCHDWLRTGQANSTWLQHGGTSTIESYHKIPVEEWSDHLAFFDRMQNYIVDEENRLFIHAGFSSMHGPEKEVYASNFSWDRTLWETALAVHNKLQRNDKVFPKRLKLFNEIFIGHTPTINWDVAEPWKRCNVWNVDTGAAFTGKLSLLNIANGEFWQSDPLTVLYKGETGRNRSAD